MTPGILIEGLIIVLLFATICYCAVLSNRLKKLKSDESALRSTIAELLTATELAERAIKGLKASTTENQKLFGTQLYNAEKLNSQLSEKLDQGDRLMEKLIAITQAVPAAPPRRTEQRIETRSEVRPEPRMMQSNARAVSDLASEATARLNALRNRGAS